MTTIVTRSGKAAPLTNTELDANFTNLNTDKLEKGSNLSDLQSVSQARTNLGLGNLATQNKASLAGPVVLTDSSTSPALKITQTGTGNALVVEDAASDTTPFVIDSAGRVGIGVTPNAGETLNISKIIDTDGGGVAFGVRNYGTIQPSVTNTFYGYISNEGTAASAFTLSHLQHFTASPATFGAGSKVTTQYGFHAAAGLTGATNNYGFYSNIAAETGRWNFYAAGTADNVFNGNVKVINGSAGLGYGTGAGGSVTQATNKSTAVTLNKPCGQITMNNAALAAGAQVNFTLTNSLITVNDLILVNVRTPSAALYSVRAGDIASGSFLISLTNVSGSSLADAVVISFAIIKGAVA